jgi:EAL domain-containing protein (putative c-di-GMP-specific phosphodiesterase class I)
VESHGVACSQIELEITEALFINDTGLCQPAIEELRGAGFRVCLDDFGTGYSSLNCLRRFGIDKIKLDRSFIDTAARDQSIAMMRAAVVARPRHGPGSGGRGNIVGEEEQIALEAGCDGVQGYFYARPMPLEQIDAFIADWQSGRVRSAAA